MENKTPRYRRENRAMPLYISIRIKFFTTASCGLYRPISNLTFLSKVVERLVCRQLATFLDNHKLLPELQSVYRKHQSTETAVLKIVSDILQATDSGKVTLVGLLDMSAAFDTVDHAILLDRLHTTFGVSGTVQSCPGLNPSLQAGPRLFT